MAYLELSFFNALDVRVRGERITSFRSANVQGLLVFLVLEAETAHARDWLAPLFWPDESQAIARKNLRQALYQLRKLLGQADRRETPLFIATRQTVQFNTRADHLLDVALFEAAIARQAFELAASYYTGPLLPAFRCDSRPFEEWLDRKRDGYGQVALEALSTLAERHLAPGKPATGRALALARRQLDLEPWREEAHRQLMRALALSGDRSGAIAHFDLCSDVLAEELGVSPAPETFALFAAIRDGTFPPADGATRAAKVPNNIPHPATPLVGRSAEIGRLATYLSDAGTRLVTIVGPGGMGKTRLAVETAHRVLGDDGATPFPDGSYFVDLAAATSRQEMLAACAASFGFGLERNPEPLQQIVNFTAGRQLLLLLDNFEQLVGPPARAAELVAALLRDSPRLKLLVTSRQKLNLTGERTLPLGGLGLPGRPSGAGVESSDAMQLFAQSARRVQPTFQLTDHNAPHVAAICRRAAGMPLAILLTAAWSNLLTPAEIVAEMRADVDFVAAEMPDLPARQRSLRAVFDHSWARLLQPEQRLLARLSVFRGGFTRAAAEAVAGATLRRLLGLVNKSFLQRNVESGRFHMHELVRTIAAEKLEATGHVEAVRTAHSRFYLGLFETHYAGTYGPGQREGLALLAAAGRNIRAGWLWAATRNDTGLMLAAIEPFHFYFTHSGRDLEIMQLYRQALARLPEGDPTFADTADDTTLVRAAILNRLQERGFSPDEAGTPVDIDRLYAYFRARGAKLEEAITCQHLGFRELARQNEEQAIFYLQRQIVLLEEIGATVRLTHTLANLSTIAFRAGRVEQGLALARRYLALAEAGNDRLSKAGALALMGAYTLGEKCDYAAADTYFAQVTALGLALLADGLTARFASMGLAYQAYIALLQGDLVLARHFSRRQQEVVARQNNARDRADAHVVHCLLAATAGNYCEVDAELLSSTSISHVYFTPLAYRLSACGRGDTAAALTSLLSEWALPITLQWPSFILRDLPVTAFILAEAGALVRAAELLAMGRAHPACPVGWWEQMDLVRTLEARLQDGLSPAEYAAAQERGPAMDVQETAQTLLQELKAMAS